MMILLFWKAFFFWLSLSGEENFMRKSDGSLPSTDGILFQGRLLAVGRNSLPGGRSSLPTLLPFFGKSPFSFREGYCFPALPFPA